MEEVNISSNRFFTMTENVKETLDKYGVAIIPNILELLLKQSPISLL